MYTPKRVDDITWTFEAIMPDGDTVRFFVLVGEEKCLVIDSGFLPIDIHGMAAELLYREGLDLTKDGEKKPILLANTHADMDHIGGNASFSTFYITKIDYERCGLSEKLPGSEYIPAEEGTTIDLGGRVLRYYLAPGHTYGNAVLLDETNRILFPGDMVQTGNMFMFGAHRCPDQMADSLRKLQGLKGEFDKIYACHGQMILPANAVDEVLKAWEKVLYKQVTPVVKRVFQDTDVDMYCCGFCNFYCNREA